jgi:putative ABC transport system permease protein
MRLSNIVRLYRVRLRSRIVQELFAVAGIAVGVALLFASQVASMSLNGSVQQLTKGIVGQMRFQLVARDTHGFSERLLEKVRAVPGVGAAVPALEENANVVGPTGERSVDLVGTDPRFAYLGGPLVRRFGIAQLSRAEVFTLPAPVAQKIGASSLQPVKLEIGARVVPALLVPELLGGSSGVLSTSPIAIAPLRYVQQLTGMNARLTGIFVSSPPARDREVRAELTRIAAGRLNVRPANFNTDLFGRAAAPTNQSTGLFSAISALVGFLFAFNALLLTVPQRRNLIEDLRLDGYTRGMIVQVLLFDALALGVVASLAGLLLGDLVSMALFRANPGYLSFAFPIGSQRIVTWQSAALAVGGGLLAAVFGVLVPLRANLVVSASLEESAWGAFSHRLALGVGGAICLAITTAILLFVPQAAILGAASLTAALLLLLPILLGGVVYVFDRTRGVLAGAGSYLAVIELRSRSNRARSTAIAATGAIAVFGSVAIQGAHQGLQSGLDRLAHELNAAPVLWVAPAGVANSLTTTPFTGFDSSALVRLPGVREARVYHGSFLDVGDRRVWVIASPRTDAQMVPPSQVLQGGSSLATIRIRRGGWVAMSKAIADERKLHVGQSVTLTTPVPTTFRLAAITTNFGWPPGAVVLNADDYARAWGSADPSAYQIALQPRSSAASVQREIERALGHRSALAVQTSKQREQRFRATSRQGLARLTQISTLVLIAAVLAMAAAMGAMIWQRRPQLADMKVDGFGRRVLWRALLWESGLLLGAGCSIGALFGIYGQLLLGHALAAVTGFPVVFSAGALVALTSFGLVAAVAVAIVAVPGYLAARVRPAISLQD